MVHGLRGVGIAQPVFKALCGTEDIAQLLADWMTPWVPSPALNNEQTRGSAVPAFGSIRSSRVSSATQGVQSWSRLPETEKIKQNKRQKNLYKGAPRSAWNSSVALVIADQETPPRNPV